MRFLIGLFIVALIFALTQKPSIEEEVDVQIQESQQMHDSAMQMLIKIHEANDSLLIQKYFGNGAN